MPTDIYRNQYLKGGSPTGGDLITYNDRAETGIISKFIEQNNFESLRIRRLLDLPDLTRQTNSPLKFIVDKILKMPEFQNFDLITTPETETMENIFDMFNVPKNHPSRKTTDTYFLNSNRLLRTQTTIMWFYYLNDLKIRKLLEQQGYISALSYGKVYRKDEIDRSHFPVFHQIDGLYIIRKQEQNLTLNTLKEVLTSIIKIIFGPTVMFRFLEDTFPFTDPSTQIEIRNTNEWLEVLGGGLVHHDVLRNFGLDPSIYNGWAFGFGIERLAMIKNNIPDIRLLWSKNPLITEQFTDIESKFVEVSKYPSVVRDISFIVDKNTSLNSFYEIVRDHAGALVEKVSLTDRYENNKKIGNNKISYTFRIIFRSYEKTLTNTDINEFHKGIEENVKKDLKAIIR